MLVKSIHKFKQSFGIILSKDIPTGMFFFHILIKFSNKLGGRNNGNPVLNKVGNFSMMSFLPKMISIMDE
jgi:hypothetical protein